MTVVGQKYYRVYTKTSWGDAWFRQKYVTPLTARLQAAPGISQAQLRVHYGSGYWEDFAAMGDGSTLSAAGGLFVRISRCDDADGTNETFLWYGIIPAEQFNLLGENTGGSKTADHVMTAYGLEYLLGNVVLKAYVQDEGDANVFRIEWSPDFNRRTRTGGIVSNKGSWWSFSGGDPGVPAALQDSCGSYVFAESGGTGFLELWNIQEMLDYLRHFMPSFLDITIDLQGRIEESLWDMTPPVKTEGKSVRGLLNELISPTRGMGWCVQVSAAETVSIKVYSLLEEELTVGLITLAAHDLSDTASLDLWSDAVKTKVAIKRDTAGIFDVIEVRGGPICACGTFSMADGTLAQGWSSADETLYLNGVSTTKTGYASLTEDEKARYNDIFRNSDRMGAVFQHFPVAWVWDWKVDNGGSTERIMNPEWEPEFGMFLSEQAPYWNGQKRFLPYLPFKKGVDYTAATPVDNNRTNDVPDFQRIVAFAKRDDTDWLQLDTMTPHPAVVQAMADQAGVIIRCNPPHVMADGHFDSAEPSAVEDLDTDGVDYDTLLVTAMIPTDQTLRLEYDNGNSLGRRLVIEIPTAELWYVVEGTVVGVDGNGALERFACTEQKLRDDSGTLNAVLAAAVAWYGRPRYQATITHQQVVNDVGIGTLVTGIDADGTGSRGACVSSLTWNFRQHSTTLQTDLADLDFRQLASLGAMTDVPGKTRSERAAFAGMKKDIEQVKNDLAAPPRVSVPGGSGSTVIHLAFCKTDAGAASSIVCYLDHDSPDHTDEVTVYCSVIGGGNLNAAIPRLEDGDWLTVYFDGTYWRALSLFQKSQDCS